MKLSLVPILWLAIALVAGFELFATSLVLRPNVGATYRAYYIDKSSDCWPHETPANYTLGQTLTFIDGPGVRFDENKICGWFYPNDKGTWSYGRYSLLRFRFPPPGGALTLTLTAGAMVTPAHPRQDVAVSINGAALTTLSFDSVEPQSRTVVIPAALAAQGATGLELRFDYPDARPGTELGPNEDSHLRALRMLSLTLQATSSGS